MGPFKVYELSTGKSKEVKSIDWLLRNRNMLLYFQHCTMEDGKIGCIFTLGEYRAIPTKEFRTFFTNEAEFNLFIEKKIGDSFPRGTFTYQKTPVDKT